MVRCGSGGGIVRGWGWFFGTLLGPGITGALALVSAGTLVLVGVGVRVFVFSGLSRAWPKRARACILCGVCGVGGGCDGVVVWELYSGREHLVRQGDPFGGLLVLHSNFL